MSKDTNTSTRRLFLLGSTVALSGLAGCASTGGSNEGNKSTATATPTSTVTDAEDTEEMNQTPTETDSKTETETSGPAKFNIISIDAPTQMEVNTEQEISMQIKNVGEQEGTLTSEISWKGNRQHREWGTLDTTIDMTISAGDTKEFSHTLHYPWVQTVTLRYDELYHEQEIEFVPKEIPRSEATTTPHDAKIQITNVEEMSSITVPTYNDDSEKVFPRQDQSKFVRFTIKVTNNADQLVETLDTNIFSAFHIDNVENETRAKNFYSNRRPDWAWREGVQLNKGESFTGGVVFPVDRSVSTDQIGFQYQHRDEGVYHTVRWLP